MRHRALPSKQHTRQTRPTRTLKFHWNSNYKSNYQDVWGNALMFSSLKYCLRTGQRCGARHAREGAQLEPVAGWGARKQIGQDLRERYEVPKELPPKLLTLVRKLDDSDWLRATTGVRMPPRSIEQSRD